MKRIMVATDFSERSDRALRRAVLLARQFGAGIELVHVVDDDQPRRIVDRERGDAEKLLRQMAATLRDVDGVDSGSQVVQAAPFAGIIGAVDAAAPDLLIIGPHRRQVLRDVFVGTTAERTIRSAACPTLMVNALPAGDYRHVLQTTDISDGSRDALEQFSNLAIGQGARKSLLYIFDAPALRLAFSYSMPKDEQEYYLAEEKKDAWRDLLGFLATANLGSVDPMVRYEATSAPHEILKAGQEEEADLIVISTQGRSGLAKLLMGSVAEHVLRTSSVDVLAMPLRRPSIGEDR